MVLCAELVCVSRGRTSETKDEAFELAEAVCSAKTVVLWAMHALDGCQKCDCRRAMPVGGVLLEQRRGSG